MNFLNKTFLFLILSFVLLLSSCDTQKQADAAADIFNSLADSTLVSHVQYARGFDIFNIEGITKLLIYEPGSNKNIRNTYYLVKREIAEKYGFPEGFMIIPLDSVAVFSGTQLNAMKNLGLLEKLVGVSESDYILDEEIRAYIEEGRVAELAGNGNFYVERTLELSPSVIFHSPYQSNENNPLAAIKIPMIPFFDFMENDPLGRAEWLKFTAVFFGKEKLAEQQFDTIVRQYKMFRELAAATQHHPTVFSDKYFSGQWYVAGGKSYIATLFKDAGADYIWKADNHIASFPLDYETVYAKAHDADFWRIVLSFNDQPSYDALAKENELYTHFAAFKNRKIIWCDAKKTAYFEKSSLEPQWVLADFIKVFHPELLPDYESKYYSIFID